MCSTTYTGCSPQHTPTIYQGSYILGACCRRLYIYCGCMLCWRLVKTANVLHNISYIVENIYILWTTTSQRSEAVIRVPYDSLDAVLRVRRSVLVLRACLITGVFQILTSNLTAVLWGTFENSLKKTSNSRKNILITRTKPSNYRKTVPWGIIETTVRQSRKETLKLP